MFSLKPVLKARIWMDVSSRRRLGHRPCFCLSRLKLWLGLLIQGGGLAGENCQERKGAVDNVRLEQGPAAEALCSVCWTEVWDPGIPLSCAEADARNLSVLVFICQVSLQVKLFFNFSMKILYNNIIILVIACRC